MSYWPLIKNRFFSKDPFFLILFVTSKCNAHCKMCFYWENIENWKRREELSLTEIEKITNNIYSIQQLTLSGGEPFLRKDLDEICTLFNRNCNVQFITIPTNGLQPSLTEKTLTKTLKKNPNVHFRIGLSTSGIKDDLDKIFEVKSSFKKHQETFRVIQNLKKRFTNINVDAGIVFSRINEKKIKSIIQYILDYMPDANPIVSLVRGNPRIYDCKEYSFELLNELYALCKNEIPKKNNRKFGNTMNLMRDMLHQMTLLMIKEKRMIIPCECGKELLVIYDNGDLFPCELLSTKLGNLRENNYDIHEILKQSTARYTVKNIKKSKCFCTWECALNNNIVFSNKFAIQLGFRYFLYKIGRD